MRLRSRVTQTGQAEHQAFAFWVLRCWVLAVSPQLQSRPQFLPPRAAAEIRVNVRHLAGGATLEHATVLRLQSSVELPIGQAQFQTCHPGEGLAPYRVWPDFRSS